MTDQQKTDQLLANLRKVESGQDDGFDPAAACTMWHRNPEGPEAADLIERLRAEWDEAAGLCDRASELMRLCTAPEKFEGVTTLSVYAQMMAWLSDHATFLQSIARETGK